MTVRTWCWRGLILLDEVLLVMHWGSIVTSCIVSLPREAFSPDGTKINALYGWDGGLPRIDRITNKPTDFPALSTIEFWTSFGIRARVTMRTANINTYMQYTSNRKVSYWTNSTVQWKWPWNQGFFTVIWRQVRKGVGKKLEKMRFRKQTESSNIQQKKVQQKNLRGDNLKWKCPFLSSTEWWSTLVKTSGGHTSSSAKDLSSGEAALVSSRELSG